MGASVKLAVAVSLIVTILAAGTVAANDPNFKRDCKDLFCHWVSADAHAEVLSERNGHCPAQGEYDAAAGPIGVDPGGDYTAEGGGNIIVDDKFDSASYPMTAHVEETDHGTVPKGEKPSIFAEAKADSLWGTKTADDSDSQTCT